MTIELNTHASVVHEDATFEVRRELSKLIGQTVHVNLTAIIRVVGSKGMNLEITDVFGDRQTIIVPIDSTLVAPPADA